MRLSLTDTLCLTERTGEKQEILKNSEILQDLNIDDRNNIQNQLDAIITGY